MSEDNIITTSTFLENLLQLLKIGIYINKGTDKDNLLDECVNIHNKLRDIYEDVKLVEDVQSTAFLRVCIKRFNLFFKIYDDGTPVNLKKKQQPDMIFYSPHSSITENNLDSAITYAKEKNICIFPKVPFDFIFRESEYMGILWQYFKLVFYITQNLISSNMTHDPNNRNLQKKKLYEESCDEIEKLIVSIIEMENDMNIKETVLEDGYIKTKLISEDGFTSDNICKAVRNLKKLIEDKGIKSTMILSMIDNAEKELVASRDDFDSAEGMISNIIGISKGIAESMSPSLVSEGKNDIKKNMKDIFSLYRTTVSKKNNGVVPKNMDDLISKLENDQINTDDGLDENYIKKIFKENNMSEKFYDDIMKNSKK